MTSELGGSVEREARALARTLVRHELNNDTEKAFMWASLALFFLAALLILVGLVEINSGAQQWVWEFLKGGALVMFGRVWGKERATLDATTD